MPKRHAQLDSTRRQKPCQFQPSAFGLARSRTRVLALWLACVPAAISCAAPARLMPASGYELQLGRQHPLAGRVYAPAQRAFSSPAQLKAALDVARYVVLGETHDNPDQHRLQAELVNAFLDRHAGAQVAFEMLDEKDAAVLAGHAPKSADELAASVEWDESGWPEFRMYRPIFEVALARRAPLLAAHPSSEHLRASMQGLSAEDARALQLEQPLPESQIAAQREEIRESHCGHANDAMLTAMQRAQAYKDAFMARALRTAQTATVLIAGRGHARNDRAVPYFLHRHRAEHVLSVAFMDVSDDRVSAADYDVAAFDFVVFTPRVSDEDPCEAFRKQLEQMRKPAQATCTQGCAE